MLLFLIAVFVAALLRLLWLRYRPPPKQMLVAAGIAFGIIGLMALVATGRLHWIAAALAMGLPLAMRILGALGMLRLLQRLGGAGGPTPFPGGGGGGGSGGDRNSKVTSRFLHMELDHGSGELEGRIVDGPHSGASLADLTLAEQLELLAHYQREDQDSARLLETWLDRNHGPTWREATSSGSDPSHQEALRILGLEGRPDRRAIIAAHRRMMQKFHPDHGGSEELAARINAAKERLLRDLESS
ncbi:MAG: molecular chaperone DnaJ [Gammaproteobacteria bacterium]|nr:molecular chaperone DnaJ [Gammaproteobacteria bacterium]